jgi:Cu(I)/Ag(I) efflux system periplasmic protein CusF
MKLAHLIGIATLGSAALAAHAQTTPASSADHTAHHPATATAAAPQSDGEVRKIDLAQAKVTLRHGPLANLDMPPMTMVFKAADPKLLQGLKEGDKVKFTAERIGGVFTVTAIQVAR